MKILSLRLKPYGPFKDNLLDFKDGEEAFHLVYGPNESGKTATLRALRALLFGIPERTADDFRHEAKKLRIGALIKHSDGTSLTFQRRKGRSKTLLTEDERELSDSQLEKFLGGVDESAFSLMFGFGHEELVRGGKEIASGKGDVGQSLFTAGSGISGLNKVLEGLDSEADKLFKQRASSAAINQAVGRYKDARNQIKELSLQSKSWAEHEDLLKTAERRKEEVKKRLDVLQARLNRLERIQQALPVIGKRKETLSQKEQLGVVLILPESFKEARSDVLKSLEQAMADESRAVSHIKSIGEKIGLIAIPEELLGQKKVIEDIYVRLGSYLKEMKDLPTLKERRVISRTEAKTLLSELRPGASLEEASMLRTSATKREYVLSLVTRHGSLEEKRNSVIGQIESLTSKKSSAEGELEKTGESVDTRKLKKVTADIQKDGDIETAFAKAVLDLKTAEDVVDRGIAKLPLWQGTIEEIEVLSVSLPKSVDRYEAAFDGIDKKIAQIELMIKDKGENIEQIDRDIAALDISGSVPTEEDLKEARLMREKGWELVKKAWLEKRPNEEKARAYHPELPLDQAYEKSVIDADQIADRLRRESDRVSQKVILLVNRNNLLENRTTLETQKQESITEKEGLVGEWVSLWSPLGFNPLTPREMRSWSQSQQLLAKEAENVRSRRREAARLGERLAAHRASLKKCLQELGYEVNAEQSLSEMIEESQTVIKHNEDIERRRAELQRTIKEVGKELTAAIMNEGKIQAETLEWSTKWRGAMTELGLAPETAPSEAAVFVTRSQDLFAKLDGAQELESRIAAIEDNLTAFRSSVKQLTERISPDLSTVPTEQAVSELHSRLTKAVADNATLMSLNTELSTYTRDLESATDAIAKTEIRIQALLNEARCENLEQLLEVERKSDRARSLQDTLEQLEKQLFAYSAGMSIEAFIAEASEADPDSLPNSIKDLQNEIETLKGESSGLEQTIGAETSLLKQMDGTSRAATAAERAQEAAAQIEGYTERYVKLRLASAILRNEIERYRSLNQGPVLERASQIFSTLTLGSFSRLKTTFDDKDAQILVGVRKDAEEDEVRVEGMSDGTCDQLYLALRLASLERYLESNEPMPLVIDDALVNFDDARADACLRIFSEISEKTQMIYFTHHQHILDLAIKAIPANKLMVHHLS